MKSDFTKFPFGVRVDSIAEMGSWPEENPTKPILY
jgi:hypothetical protein